MTSALYKQILKKPSYMEKLKDLIDYDDVINNFISRDIIDEKEYLELWRSKGNKIDTLFRTLKKKSHILRQSFDVLKSLYGTEMEVKLNEIKRDLIDNIHQKGGFPKINTYIPRIEQEDKIKGKLAKVKWDNSLVVFGRVGEGKSYLVCECLKDVDLIFEHFNNHLFWINVGECENGSNILQPLTRLLRMVAPTRKELYDLDELIEELREIFASEKYKKSLVILDNARSLEVIENFQRIRCKLIIITHFKNVKYAEFVEVNLGFTLNETLSLFAQYLNTTTKNLNNLYLDDIKDLLELCKGHPTTLALLSVYLSYHKDNALTSKILWKHIKEKIDKGEIETLGNDDVDIIYRNFYRALSMCIGTIKTEEKKQLYYQLAVFPKDANISTDVFEVFWNKKPEEVWNIMSHFEDRSLINSFYNINKKVYIYVIHDLFLYYLKNETRLQKKEYHRKLIESYESRYEYYNLPNDNYILLFLGYHLKQAEMFDRFEKFLDLRFIEHKIKIVGVNNMEQDLKMYKDEIISGNEDLRIKWENCLRFIRDNKNELQQLQKTDIIQLALPTLIDDAQTLMARNQANSINKLYFTTKLSAGRLKSSYELYMKEEVSAMAYCFDSNVPKILMGLTNGDIILCCPQTTKKEFERFQNHKRSVFDLKVSSDNSCFLSVSEDRTVKLWQFFSQRLSLDGLTDVVTSPKCVQNEYFDAFSPGKKHNFKEFVYEEDGAYLISANFSNKYSEQKIICTGTNNGKIIIWYVPSKEKLCVTTETGFPARNIYFSNDDLKVYFTKQEKIQVYKYEFRELEYIDSITNKEDIEKLYVTNVNTLIAVGRKYVMMFKLPYEEPSNTLKLYETSDRITCSSIARDEYLAIGIKENVFLFGISTEHLMETLKHTKQVISMAMDILKDDDNITSMISMKFDNNNIQQCNIIMQHYGQPRNEQNLVTSYWKTDQPMLALVFNDNVLTIQHEFTIINEIQIPQKITFITFSLCGNNIIFALENGDITEYQYKRQGAYKTLATLGKTVNYLQCIELESSTDHHETSYNSSDSYNGAIVVLTDGDTEIHILLGAGQMKKFSWEIAVFKIFPMSAHRLLCVDISGGIFIIHIDKESKDICTVKYAIWDKEVCSAAFCPKKNLVAIMFTEKVHRTKHLEIISINSIDSEKVIFTIRLPELFTPTCCAFSYFGQLLVLGSNDGRIMIVSLQNNFTNSILNASNFPIKFVQFSKSELPILVAVGKEVSWWNLKSLDIARSEGKQTSCNYLFDLEFWKNKTVHHEVPYLLQTVSLYSNAVHFSTFENFEAFLVVDDESRIYVIKCFKSVQ